MVEVSQEDTEDTPTSESAASGSHRFKGRRSFSRARREMNEEEETQSGVQKMMLDEVDRLENENGALKSFVGRYHDADKKSAVLEEKLTKHHSSEIVYSALMTVGAAAIGYSASAGADGSPDFVILVFGLVLVIAGIVSKVIVK